MKRFISFLGLMAAVSVMADTDTDLLVANATNSISTTPRTVTQFVITPSTVASTIAFFDSANTNTTYTYNAYTNVSFYTSTNLQSIYTNYFGVITTNTYTGVVTTNTVVAGGTNTYPIVLSLTAPSNTVTIVNGSWRFISGVTTTNTGAATVSMTFK